MAVSRTSLQRQYDGRPGLKSIPTIEGNRDGDVDPPCRCGSAQAYAVLPKPPDSAHQPAALMREQSDPRGDNRPDERPRKHGATYESGCYIDAAPKWHMKRGDPASKWIAVCRSDVGWRPASSHADAAYLRLPHEGGAVSLRTSLARRTLPRLRSVVTAAPRALKAAPTKFPWFRWVCRPNHPAQTTLRSMLVLGDKLKPETASRPTSPRERAPMRRITSFHSNSDVSVKHLAHSILSGEP